jgi:hypothetical protein
MRVDKATTMKAREYREHRRVSRLLLLDAAIMAGCVVAVLISGALTYYATISRLFSEIIATLPH